MSGASAARTRLTVFGAAVVAVMVALSALLPTGPTPLDYSPRRGVSFPEGSTMARLHGQGSITIGIKFDQPLSGYRADPTRTPEGFDVSLGRLIASELGIATANITWVEAQTGQRERLVETGSVDLVIATYTITEERKQRVDFAGPYYIAGQALLVPADNPLEIDSPQDLADRPVCTVGGSTSAATIQRYEVRLIEVAQYSQCVPLVEDGTAVAMTSDDMVLAGLAWQHEGEFKLVGTTFTEEPYGIALAKGDDEFRDWLNTVLYKIYRDGRWEEAWNETAGQVMPDTTPPDLG